jgi:hypothetical protein
MINFDAILPPKPKAGDNGIADLEGEIARKTQRLNGLLDLEDIDAAKDRIRHLNDEIKDLKAQLVEARKTAKIAEHADDDRLDPLLETIARLRVVKGNDRYLLRAKIAQELRRVLDTVRLNDRREITIIPKPERGYQTQFELRDEKLHKIAMTHIETGETLWADRSQSFRFQRAFPTPR